MAPSGTQDTLLALTAEQGPRVRQASLEPGERIGRYEILRKLGAGGMGVVYEARDPELNRRIALKLLLPEGVGLGSANPERSRLLREAQAMARLSHPNVITVHDVGVGGERDHVYIAMELIDGHTLREWWDAESRAWPEVLAVMRGAARGLAAAHEVGIVHRDFKPDNVMLDAGGRVWVMDFGLARADAGPEEEVSHGLAIRGAESGGDVLSVDLTATGSIIGTPAYMAPEQFQGRPTDPRTDVFSFCVTLYEGLYGVRPFEGTTLAALTSSVLDGSIRSVPTMSEVPAWLRRVTERGLAVAPEHRWPSMGALLQELARDRGARRRRLAIGAIGLAGVGAVAAQAVGDGDPCRSPEEALDGVWDDARRDALREALLGSGVGYAQSTAQRVEGYLDAYADAWMAQRAEACAEESEAVMDARMVCLDERRAALRGLVDVLSSGDAGVKDAVSAAARLPIGSDCTGPLVERGPLPPNAEIRDAVQRVQEELAVARGWSAAGKYDQARAASTEVADAAARLGYPPLLAEALEHRARTELYAGDEAAAERTWKEAYFLAVEHGMDRVAARSASELMSVIGVRQHRIEEAWTWNGYARAHVEGAERKLTDAFWLTARGDLQHTVGDFDAARKDFERALALRIEVLGPDHPAVADALGHLETIAARQGRAADARAYGTQALEIRERVLSPDHPDVAAAHNNLGLTAFDETNYEEAVEHLQRAHDVWLAALGSDNKYVPIAKLNLGRALRATGRLGEARRLLEEAIEQLERLRGPESMEVLTATINLANVAQDERRLDEAVRLLRRALELGERMGGADGAWVAVPAAALGQAELARGNLQAARAYSSRALELYRTKWGPEHVNVGYVLSDLGEIAAAAGDLVEARAWFGEALEHNERSFGPEHEAVANDLGQVALLDLREGKTEEGLASLKRAVEMGEATGLVERKLGQLREALAAAQR